MATNYKFSVDDVLALSPFALALYRQCRDCDGPYENLAVNVRQVANLLQDLEDFIRKHKQQVSGHLELTKVGKDCHEVLAELDALLSRYNGLSAHTKKAWNELSPDEHGGARMNDQLLSTIEALTTLYKDLLKSPQLRLDKALNQILRDIENGHRDASDIVSLATASGSIDDNVWSRVVHDFEESGVSSKHVTEHKLYVIDWLRRACEEGRCQVKSTGAANELNRPLLISEDRVPASSVEESVDTQSEGSKTYRRAESQLSNVENLSIDLLQTSEAITQYWNAASWSEALFLLKQLLEAVESGHSFIVNGETKKPDRRVLRYLLGVCASYHGDYALAKDSFQKVLPPAYDTTTTLDEGVLCAATWLGDTCVLLKEPENAALAWSLAVVSISADSTKNLVQRSHRSHLLGGLSYLNTRTHAVHTLNWAYHGQNADKTSILSWWPVSDKSRIVASAADYFSKIFYDELKGKRAATSIKIANGFLIQPLVSKDSWPIKYDPFFVFSDAIDLAFSRSIDQLSKGPIQLDNLPAPGLKGKLHYVTKKDAKWLVDTLNTGLAARGIKSEEWEAAIMCRLKVPKYGLACQQIIAIKLHKLLLKKSYGIQVTQTLRQTRSHNGPFHTKTDNIDITKLLVSIVQEILGGDVHPSSLPPGFAEADSRPVTDFPESDSLPIVELATNNRNQAYGRSELP